MSYSSESRHGGTNYRSGDAKLVLQGDAKLVLQGDAM